MVKEEQKKTISICGVMISASVCKTIGLHGSIPSGVKYSIYKRFI